MRPLAIDLYCGLGGWTEGLLAEGYEVIGFDVERHEYGGHKYPGQLILQDVRTLHGRQFRDAALIVASPPCQAYSWRAMPWRAAREAPPPDNELFEACFRIQREACDAAGRHIPLVVENVRGAQKWVGRSRWNFGSYHLWGDVPALMPMVVKVNKLNGFRRDGCKNGGGSWFGISASDGRRGVTRREDGSGDNCPDGRHWPRDPMSRGDAIPTPEPEAGIKQPGIGGPRWWRERHGRYASQSSKRKAAAALIARIPLDLARHIGRVYYPRDVELAG